MLMNGHPSTMKSCTRLLMAHFNMELQETCVPYFLNAFSRVLLCMKQILRTLMVCPWHPMMERMSTKLTVLEVML